MRGPQRPLPRGNPPGAQGRGGDGCGLDLLRLRSWAGALQWRACLHPGRFHLGLDRVCQVQTVPATPSARTAPESFQARPGLVLAARDVPGAMRSVLWSADQASWTGRRRGSTRGGGCPCAWPGGRAEGKTRTRLTVYHTRPFHARGCHTM